MCSAWSCDNNLLAQQDNTETGHYGRSRVPQIETSEVTHACTLTTLIYRSEQGRMKRRGHVTTIHCIINGRGLMSKNSKECIARALFLCVHDENIRKLTEKVAILAKL